LIIKKSDYADINKIQNYLKNLKNLTSPRKISLFKKYLDHFTILNKLYNKILCLFSTTLLDDTLTKNIKDLALKNFINFLFKKSLKTSNYIYFLLYFFKFLNIINIKTCYKSHNCTFKIKFYFKSTIM